MGAYEFAGGTCIENCSPGVPNDTVDINDFLELLAQWELTCTSCDFAGDPGVGIDEFLALIAAWGPCLAQGPEPDSIEEAVTDAGLEYPDDWDEFVDVLTDDEEDEEVKENYLCWMDHYLDCHRDPFCMDCGVCTICPDSDPYGNH